MDSSVELPNQCFAMLHVVVYWINIVASLSRAAHASCCLNPLSNFAIPMHLSIHLSRLSKLWLGTRVRPSASLYPAHSQPLHLCKLLPLLTEHNQSCALVRSRGCSVSQKISQFSPKPEVTSCVLKRPQKVLVRLGIGDPFEHVRYFCTGVWKNPGDFSPFII